MTEPNTSPLPETPGPDLDVQWPDDATPTGDALVDRALGLLEGVPDSPVAEHGELYAGIHDSLLEALDAEPGLPAAPRPNSPEGDS
ncbi:hypothetical protein FQP90_20160 [Paenarthrobacter nitroguajacolicus]|uniref:Uncharacterized protein n=1 Tax=Paenarthrobacter nitroguajacolicus TaxID=211146 RepID=A0A558GQH3_PAENT|nr:hypothetical protein [Paenarthrobacter nitroguajacolicus]TVU59132.1 hypothetical protein FQP90_20160 [Paenarthrobacter nitroguajacolicus]